MYVDVVDLRAFYSERLGLVARRLIGTHIKGFWPEVRDSRILGIGYATPYLPLFTDAERVLAFMPAPQGVVNWPTQGPNAVALVLDDMLPLPDASVDRVLAVHSLEMTQNVHDLLREIWRVLAPGGRLIAVVPNRRGIWARVESTPFGYGSPFSRGQLNALFRETLFSPANWADALSMPPIKRRMLYRTGAAWERFGAALWPGFAGVIVVEATKQLYQGIPARETVRARRLAPALRPVLIPPGRTALNKDAQG
jgi:SAM-dependent methyltransferase